MARLKEAAASTHPVVAMLLEIVDQAFDRKSWHGTTLRGSLRGLTAGEAVWRPAPGRHNIWELTLHAAYWKYAVRRRLAGESVGSFERKPSNWPAVPTPADGSAWKRDVAFLESEHRKLRAIVAGMKPADLVAYARLCGTALARAHARSGDRIAITGYLGESDTFDRAVADFALAYADQTTADHAALGAAVAAGVVHAAPDV